MCRHVSPLHNVADAATSLVWYEARFATTTGRFGACSSKEKTAMKRGQWFALAGGTALGLACVSLGVILARREGREAARRWIEQYGMPLADQAKQIGTQIANTAIEQYQMQLPKAVDAWNTYAPQA